MRISKSLLLTSAIALLTLTCEQVPDYCGSGVVYEPSCEFCYGSRPYLLCENEKKEYNPLVQGCVPTTKVIGTRCANDSVVTQGTPCGGYTLTVAATPAEAGTVTPIPALPIGQTYPAEAKVVLNAVSTNADYEFFGWAGAQPTGGVMGQGAEYTMKNNGVSPQVTIVAMFKPKSAGKLIVDAHPKGAGEAKPMPDKGGGEYEDGEEVTVTATANSGYVFDGWSGADTSKDNPATIKMNRNEGSKTLVAVFKPVSYTLRAIVTPDSGGAVYISTGAIPNGESRGVETNRVAVYAREWAGYAFDGWSGTRATFDDPNNAETVVTIEQDAVITARFTSGGGGTIAPPQKGTYTLTVKTVTDGNGNGGSVSLNPETGQYNWGATVTATATANDGFDFTGWSGASTGTTNLAQITMDGDKTLTATFKSKGTPPDSTIGQTYTLTVGRNPTDGGTTNISSQTNINAGQQVNITATAASGYTFNNWTISGSGTIAAASNASTSVTVNGNVTVTANFTQATAPTVPDTAYVPFLVNVNATVTVVFSSNIVSQVQMSAAANSESILRIPLQTSGNAQGIVTVSASGYVDTTYTLNVSKGTNARQNITLRASQGGGGGVTSGPTVSYGGQEYTSVVIGGKTWMAQNLNYATESGSWCYGNEQSNCNKYGRLYDWSTAMGGASSSTSNPSGVRGVCPEHWHLPSRGEWQGLVDFVGSPSGTKLKSAEGWEYYNDSYVGTDDYGFSALPGGIRYSDGSYNNAGNYGLWWSATEYDGSYAQHRYMYYHHDVVNEGSNRKSYGISVRCVGD